MIPSLLNRLFTFLTFTNTATNICKNRQTTAACGVGYPFFPLVAEIMPAPHAAAVCTFFRIWLITVLKLEKTKRYYYIIANYKRKVKSWKTQLEPDITQL